MKFSGILLRKMLTRNSGHILMNKNYKVLISASFATFGMNYTYNWYRQIYNNKAFGFAEAEPKKKDPYSRSRAKELMKNHEEAVIIGG